jgi:hypothetical protein
MNPGRRFGQRFCAILPLVMAMIPVVFSCSGAQIQQVVEKPVPQRSQVDLLQTCEKIADEKLKDIRGCYDTYYFAMDVGINMANSRPRIDVRFTSQVPEGSAPSFNGNMASYNSPNGNVSFQAGVGNTSMGKGVFNVVCVAGNNNIVIANTNVNINIPGAGNRTFNPMSGFTTPSSLTGTR